MFPLQARLWPRGWVEVQLYSSMTAALEGGEWSAARPSRPIPPGKDSVPIVQEAGWAPALVWTGGKSRPTRIRSPDHPARSQSLYRLSYPAHKLVMQNVLLSNLQQMFKGTTPCLNTEADMHMQKACNFLHFSREF